MILHRCLETGSREYTGATEFSGETGETKFKSRCVLREVRSARTYFVIKSGRLLMISINFLFKMVRLAI